LAGDLVAAALENIQLRAIGCGNVTGVPTGFPRFDELTDGLQPENLIMLGGLSGVEMTAFALTVAAHAALQAHVPTLLFSLQWSKREVVDHLLGSESAADAERLRRSLIEPSEGKAEIHPDEGGSKAPPFVIDGSTMLTLDDLQTKLDAFLYDERLFPTGAAGHRALVIVDSIRQLRPGRRHRPPSERKIAKVICGLKEVAKGRRVTVLATSTLNGNLFRREDKRPRLSDLDRSGSIENNADVVLFLHRRVDESGDHGPDAFATDLIIAKHRTAQTASLSFTFDPKCLRFAERAREPEA
jgi:replicative DNA helicase